MEGTVSEPDDQRQDREIRRAADQFVTARETVTTRHCFSFGNHYDPARIQVGPLVALNDECLAPGGGYDSHHHRGLDIVTWVLEGTLRHEDSTGRVERVRAGSVQRLTAGSGVDHSETNDGSSGDDLRFLQLWFALEEDVAPAYETRQLLSKGERPGWTTIASSEPALGVRLAGPGIEVAVCRLPAGANLDPASADVRYAESFGYLAAGSVSMPGGVRLDSGDSLRMTRLSDRGGALGGVVEEDLELLVVWVRPTAQGR